MKGSIVSDRDDDAPVIDVPVSSAHDAAAREGMRSRLAADVEAFLSRGGSIVEVPQDYRADLPKRLENSYGRGSI